jgi:pheromone shutdown protein TraB
MLPDADQRAAVETKAQKQVRLVQQAKLALKAKKKRKQRDPMRLPDTMLLGGAAVGLDMAAPKERSGRLASPAKKPASFVTLTNPATKSTVHVVGVCHLSPQSQEDARQVIHDTCPDVICVELGRDRAKALEDITRRESMLADLRDHRNRRILPPLADLMTVPLFPLAACAAAATVPLFPLAWCFAGPVIWNLWTTECIEYLADTSQGAEMMVAIQEGRRCGSQLYAIDRDFDATCGRCLAELDIGSILTVLKVLQGLFVDDDHISARAVLYDDILTRRVKTLLESDDTWLPTDVLECRALARSVMHGMVGSAGGSAGGGFTALGPERDQYLAHNLWRASNKPNSTTVAVVGAAHVDGIQQHFGKTTDADMQDLDQFSTGMQVRVGAFASAVLLAPAASSWVAYRALAARFSPIVARCGFIGLGTAVAAYSIGIGNEAYSALRRLQYETAIQCAAEAAARCGVTLETAILANKAVREQCARVIYDSRVETLHEDGSRWVEMTNPNTKQLRQIHIDVAADFGITSLQLQAANDHWKGEPALATALHECKALQQPWHRMLYYSAMATESAWSAACLSLATEPNPRKCQF